MLKFLSQVTSGLDRGRHKLAGSHARVVRCYQARAGVVPAGQRFELGVGWGALVALIGVRNSGGTDAFWPPAYAADRPAPVVGIKQAQRLCIQEFTIWQGVRRGHLTSFHPGTRRMLFLRRSRRLPQLTGKQSASLERAEQRLPEAI
jgi:hypothetical protein